MTKMNSLQELNKVAEDSFKRGYEKRKQEEDGGCPKCLECGDIVTADDGCYCVPCSEAKPVEDDNPED